MKDCNKGIVLLFLSSLIMFCSCQKEAKQFSLFSVVSFKQEECSAVSTSGLKGVCMTATECNGVSGGTSDGNCAAAFGVCCVVTVSTCGSTVTQNCSYIDNPSYPTSYTTTGDCSYTVARCQDDICQIRLDFFSTTLQQPSTTADAIGDCTNTILDITAGTTSDSITTSPPNLCGTLTGQHIYLDSGRAATAATLKFTLASAASNQWRIKVTQIECWNPSKAPMGCLQYFSGAHRHTVTSFNYDGSAACTNGCMLSDEMYRICFRPEKGMCSQTFSQTAVSSSEDSFQVGGNSQDAELLELGTNTQAKCSMTATAMVYLIIHSVNAEDDDRYCGDYLNTSQESTTAGAVNAQSSSPFQFTVVSDEDIEDLLAGFSLDVQQTACGPSAFGNQNAVS